jgi:fructose-bisphosphate aldolase class II
MNDAAIRCFLYLTGEIPMIVTLRQLLDHAAEHAYGVPAFNFVTMEQVKAIMAAAAKTDSPVILSASTGAIKYAGMPYIRALVAAAIEDHPDTPVVLHLDHGPSPQTCRTAIGAGFTSVMMDGSLLEDAKTPSDYDYNVRMTMEVVAMAHAAGASVEGELGCLGRLDTMTAGKEDGSGAEGITDTGQLLTDPEQARDFVKLTNVDALAIAIGTSHGAYKFSKPPTGSVLQMDRIAEIHRILPNTHLVMHGSSSVPQDWLATINQYGGKMKETYGVPLEEIREGIRNGVRKINVDTDLRMAWTGSVRKGMDGQPGNIDLRKFLKPAIDAMQAICEERFIGFGTAGHASRFRTQNSL